MTFDEIVDHFHARRVGKEYIARCTGHDDQSPSLNITQKDGRILFICRSQGCSYEHILAGAGLKPSDLNGAAAFNGAKRPKQDKARAIPENIKAVYDYTDEAGQILFEVIRYEEPGREKTFRQRRPDGKGGWVWNLDGVRQVPYRLPEVLRSEHVMIVEGEKDCKTAWDYGLTATCNAMGAGKWTAEHAQYLRGKCVSVVPDNDEAGRKHALQVAASLVGVAASIAICKLPGGIKDLTHFAELGLSRESLIQLIEQAPPWKPEPETGKRILAGRSLAEIFAAKPAELEWQVWPIFARGITTMLDGLPKLSGKTSLLLAAIKASRDGRDFLGRPTKFMRVCYLSEQSELTLAVQLEEAGFTESEVQKIPKEEFLVIPREAWDIPGYTYFDMLAQLEEQYLQKANYDGLVTDTFHSIAQLSDQNDDSEVLRVSKLTTSLSVRYNLGSVLNRHDRKAGGALGVSGRNTVTLTGCVDNVLHLTQIPGRASNFRKLEMGGRTLGFPEPLLISRENGGRYVVWEGDTPAANVVNEQRAEKGQKILNLIVGWLRADKTLRPGDLCDRLREQKIERSERTVQTYVTEARKKLKDEGCA